MLLLNTALVGCIVSLCVLLALALNGAPALVPHVAFLLALAVGLLVLINWRALDSAASRTNMTDAYGLGWRLSSALAHDVLCQQHPPLP